MAVQDELTLHLFNISDGAELNIRLVSSEGNAVSLVTCRRKGDGIYDGQRRKRCTTSRENGFTVLAASITNGKLLNSANGSSLLEWSDPGKPWCFLSGEPLEQQRREMVEIQLPGFSIMCTTVNLPNMRIEFCLRYAFIFWLTASRPS